MGKLPEMASMRFAAIWLTSGLPVLERLGMIQEWHKRERASKNGSIQFEPFRHHRTIVTIATDMPASIPKRNAANR
jgi:hypothetical protein